MRWPLLATWCISRCTSQVPACCKCLLLVPPPPPPPPLPINFIILTLSRKNKNNEIEAPNIEAVCEIMRIRPNMEWVCFVFEKNGGKGFQMVDTKAPNSLPTNQTYNKTRQRIKVVTSSGMWWSFFGTDFIIFIHSCWHIFCIDITFIST